MCKTPLVIWNKPKSSTRKSRLYADDWTTDLDEVDLKLEEPNFCVLPKKAVLSPSAVVDHGFPFRVVPCGRCTDCAKSKRSGWYVRARRQIECGQYKAVYWVLWTWKNSTIPKTKDELSDCIRRYKDRLRKKYGYTPDHFMVTERGEDDRYTKRLHIHGFLCFKNDAPTFESIRRDWFMEGFVFVRKLGSLPDGRTIAPSAAITYSMKYMFKAFMYRIEGDKLSGCIYASLGFGLAKFSSRSFRLKLGSDNTFRPSETFDGLYRYLLPRYLSERVYKNAGARPEIDIGILCCQLFGEMPPKFGVAYWLRSKQLKMLEAFRGLSYSNKCANLLFAVDCLIMKYCYEY